MTNSKRRPGASADLEEVRPNLFVVHNSAVGPTLRGEGEREGDRFLLTTWRRDGLIARLRAKSFAVLTLAEQIAALPDLPDANPPGPSLHRQLASSERASYFGAAEGHPPGWQPAPAGAIPGTVSLREGWIVRLRKGRGPGAYYRADRGAFQPLSEDAALCAGYALVALDGPASVVLSRAENGNLLPELLLPAAHRLLLGRFAAPTTAGWLMPDEVLPLAEALLARLGLVISHEA